MKGKVIARARMSTAYQITVPSVLRKSLGLKPGDEVEILAGGLQRAETQEERVKRGFAKLERLRIEREKTMTPEQKKFAKMAKGWTVSQYHEYFDNLPETKKQLKEKYGVQN